MIASRSSHKKWWPYLTLVQAIALVRVVDAGGVAFLRECFQRERVRRAQPGLRGTTA